MRQTPSCWLRGMVESGRVDAANKLREAKSLLRALGTRPGRSDRGLHRDMMENRKMLEVRP